VTQRLAIVASHPVQYHAPWFRNMAAQPGLDIEVLFGHYASGNEQAEAGFGVEFDWDVPLLEGYAHRFLTNVAAQPSVNTFGGVDTPGVTQVLRHGHYDAVLVLGWHTRAYWQAIQACWREGRAVMARSDSHLHDARPLLTRLAKELPYRYFINRLDACLPVGIWSRDYFRHYGARPERTFLVPHSAAVPSAARQPSDLRLAGRQAWDLPSDALVCLLAGKLIPRKCPLDFVRAIARASRTAAVVGLVAGDGPLREETARLAQELKAPICFAGFLNQGEMCRAYAAADVLVLPSSQETWGLVANEAMAWGLPCVVSDLVGCGPDLVEDGVTGFTVPLHDIEALATRLAFLSDDPGARGRMSQNAKSRISRFTPQTATEGVVQAMAAVLGGA